MHLLLHTDGAAKGNPGPSGIGVALYRENEREPLVTVAEYIGETTNNVAEYRALIRGLSEALLRGADSVSIRTDSELMVRQIEGRYKVSAPQIQPLHAEAKRSLAKFARYDIRHVPRAQNALADKLANQGVAAGKPGAGAARTGDGDAPKRAAAAKDKATTAKPTEQKWPFRQTHSHAVGGEVHAWDVERLWKLAAGLTPRMVPMREVAAVLDEDCWFGDTPPTVRRVADHARRICEADLTQPILLAADGRVMDGGHRIARAYLENRDDVLAVRFAETPDPDLKRPA